MRIYLFARIACLTVALAACSGCGIAPEQLDSLREAVRTASVGVASDPLLPPTNLQELQFDPPHPDRADPFSYPSGVRVTANVAASSSKSAAHIDILGFANVDTPRVILRTEDATMTLAVGDLIDGIEVIAIQPPEVDLRTGSLRWRASMFDQPTVAGN